MKCVLLRYSGGCQFECQWPTVTALVVVLMLTFGAALTARAESQDYGNATEPQPAASTDDGPHVFWQNDSVAVVFYYCDSSVSSREFTVRDSLRFTGFCRDTSTHYLIVAEPPSVAADHVDSVSRILAISDIHGDYDHFAELLIAAGVVDSNLVWAWGDGHLVINGDVFDRGPAVTECMWLIHRLEREAAAQSGAVHFLLGNHELMVLRGDLRYVNERYMNGIARRAFDYDDLFGRDTELGRWLRTKHSVVRLGWTLFVHAGLTPEQIRIAGNITSINELVRRGLDYSTTRLRFDQSTRALYGSLGPLWYRGYHYGIEDRYPAATTEQIDTVLDLCSVDQVVVGHTEQDSLQVLHGGRVIAIDVDVESLGVQQALLWEGGEFYRVTGDGRRSGVPVR